MGGVREWHLGLTEGANDETKARYAFVYGDFRRLHRTGLIACVYRASEWRHKDVEVAAHDLLQYLDQKTGLEPTAEPTGYGRSMKSRKRSRSSAGAAGLARRVQQPDARREQHRRPQSGILGLESAVDERLPDRAQHPPVASLDTGQHRFVGQRPYPHRPFERPVLRGDQRLHHHRQAFTRIDVRHVLERACAASWRLPHASTSAPRYACMSVKCQ